MKILLFGLIALLSFIVPIIGALALTGNLNREALDRVLGEAPPVTTQMAPAAVPEGLALELKKRADQLDAREQDLVERETQIAKREQAVEQKLAELRGIQQQIESSLEAQDEGRKLRMETVAVTVAEMDPEQAAKRLEGMDPAETAELLSLLKKPKDRGAIIEAFAEDYALRVLRAMQEQDF